MREIKKQSSKLMHGHQEPTDLLGRYLGTIPKKEEGRLDDKSLDRIQKGSDKGDN